MQKLLLQTSSGCVYPWSEDLAAMPGMVPYEPKAKSAPVVEEVASVEPEPAPDDIKTLARAVLTKRKTK